MAFIGMNYFIIKLFLYVLYNAFFQINNYYRCSIHLEGEMRESKSNFVLNIKGNINIIQFIFVNFLII